MANNFAYYGTTQQTLNYYCTTTQSGGGDTTKERRHNNGDSGNPFFYTQSNQFAYHNGNSSRNYHHQGGGGGGGGRRMLMTPVLPDEELTTMLDSYLTQNGSSSHKAGHEQEQHQYREELAGGANSYSYCFPATSNNSGSFDYSASFYSDTNHYASSQESVNRNLVVSSSSASASSSSSPSDSHTNAASCFEESSVSAPPYLDPYGVDGHVSAPQAANADESHHVDQDLSLYVNQVLESMASQFSCPEPPASFGETRAPVTSQVDDAQTVLCHQCANLVVASQSTSACQVCGASLELATPEVETKQNDGANGAFVASSDSEPHRHDLHENDDARQQLQHVFGSSCQKPLRAVAVARPMQRTVGVVEPRVVIKIPWAKVKEDNTKLQQRGDQVRESEANGEARTGGAGGGEELQQRGLNSSEKAISIGAAASEGRGEADEEEEKTADDGGCRHRSKKRQCRHHRHHHKRKRRKHHKHKCSRKKEDPGGHEHKLFHITETLPEHFKQALEERTNGSLLLTTATTGNEEDRKRMKKRQLCQQQEDGVDKEEGEEEEEEFTLVKRRKQQLECEPEQKTFYSDAMSASKLNPLKLIRRFLPGTNQEEYKIEDAWEQMETAAKKSPGTTEEIVDLASSDDGDSFPISGDEMADFLRKKMPLLNVSMVGDAGKVYKKTESSDQPRPSRKLVVLVRRLTSAEIKSHTSARARTHPKAIREEPLPCFQAHKDMESFANLNNSLAATTARNDIHKTFECASHHSSSSGGAAKEGRKSGCTKEQKRKRVRKSFLSYRECSDKGGEEEERVGGEQQQGKRIRNRTLTPTYNKGSILAAAGVEKKEEEEAINAVAAALHEWKLDEKSDKHIAWKQQQEMRAGGGVEIDAPANTDEEHDSSQAASASPTADTLECRRDEGREEDVENSSDKHPDDNGGGKELCESDSWRGDNSEDETEQKSHSQYGENDVPPSPDGQQEDQDGRPAVPEDKFMLGTDDFMEDTFSRITDTSARKEDQHQNQSLSMPILFSDDGQDLSSLLNFQTIELPSSAEGTNAPSPTTKQKEGKDAAITGDNENLNEEATPADNVTETAMKKTTALGAKSDENESNDQNKVEADDEEEVLCLTPLPSTPSPGKEKAREVKSVAAAAHQREMKRLGRPKKYIISTLEDVERRATELHDHEAPDTSTPPPSVSPHPRTSFKNEPDSQCKWMHCERDNCDFYTRKPWKKERHDRMHVDKAEEAATHFRFRCVDCGERFSSLMRLKRHDRKEHTGEQDYECKICEAEVTDINVHMRIHRQEKDFKCEVCSREFRHKNSLVRHLVQHSGERPFRCAVCDATFTSLIRQREHLRKKHPSYAFLGSNMNRRPQHLPAAMRQFQPIAPKEQQRPLAAAFAPILPQTATAVAPTAPMSYLTPGPNGSVFLITQPAQPQPGLILTTSGQPLLQSPFLAAATASGVNPTQIILNPPHPTQPIFVQAPQPQSQQPPPPPSSSSLSSLLSPREAAMLTVPTPDAPTPEPTTAPLLDLPERVVDLEITNADGSITLADPNTITFEVASSVTQENSVTMHSEDGGTVKMDILERAILEIPELEGMSFLGCESANEPSSDQSGRDERRGDKIESVDVAAQKANCKEEKISAQGDETPFECTKCGRQYKFENFLKVHEKRCG